MAGRPTPPSVEATDQPLLSGRVLWRVASVAAVLAVATLGLTLGGRWLGNRIALAGHTDSQEEYAIEIGRDRLRLPANVLRLAEQRHAGPAERVDLYLAWPEMQGYSKPLKARFDDVTHPQSLIFLQLSQSTMSRDMSGRLDPIYRHLFDGDASRAAFGLTLHKLRPDSGYGRDVLLTAPQAEGGFYVIRCLLPAPGEQAGNSDCQRDIRVGHDLTVLYRFSSDLLRDWQHIDAAVRSFVEQHLVDERKAQPAVR